MGKKTWQLLARDGNMILREAKEADIVGIQAIYAHYVLNTAFSFEEEPPDSTEMNRRRLEVTSKGLPYLVAEKNGKIAGFAYAGPFRTRSAYRYTLEDSIYVAPEMRSCGVGKALLGEVIRKSTLLGYRQMIAVIGDSTNTASIALHGKLGFHQEGVLRGVGYKFGRWYDVVIMHMPLSAPDDLPSG